MLTAAAAFVIVLGAVGLALWTLGMSWPQRLRWIVATSAMDITGVASHFGPYVIREVVLTGVRTESPWTAVRLCWVVNGQALDLYCLPTFTERAYLDRWEVARTPLLLVSDDDGEASLHGHRHSVTGLRIVRKTSASIEKHSPPAR